MASEFSWQMADSAQEDFDHIVGYMVRKLCNPEAATVFADDLTEALGDLCTVPLKGPLVENPYLTIEGVRFLPVRQYIVYYFPDMGEKMITVLRIGHSLQDQDKILRSISGI